MAARYQRIVHKIKTHYPDFQHLDLIDESHQHSVPEGSESHFKLLLVSENFSGKNRVSRQRSILNLLSDELKSGLHALTMRLLTPEEWEKQNSEFASPPCHSKK